MIILQLFWEYLKIGMFCVGGGMAALPFLYDLSDKTGWFTYTQIADMLAVSESTPGPIGINMATYVGYTVGGPLGSIAATLGMILPGLILALIVTTMIAKFRESRGIQGAFYGIRPASIGLIIAAGIMVAKLTFFNETILSNGASGGLFGAINLNAIILAGILLVLTRAVPRIKDLHPVFFIAFSAVVGIVFKFGA